MCCAVYGHRAVCLVRGIATFTALHLHIDSWPRGMEFLTTTDIHEGSLGQFSVSEVGRQRPAITPPPGNLSFNEGNLQCNTVSLGYA